MNKFMTDFVTKLTPLTGHEKDNYENSSLQICKEKRMLEHGLVITMGQKGCYYISRALLNIEQTKCHGTHLST